MEQTQSRFKAFLARKNVNITVKTYLIDALGAMAFGLFASLLIGTIFATLGEKSGIEIFTTISDYAKSATGAALGVSIAYALKAPQLVLFSAATVGIAGNALGGPVGALVATVVATELGKIVSKETRVDILVTPGVTIISGVLIAQFVGPGVSAFMTAFGNLVKTATEMQPFFMGILVSALIGIALTLPISSAAICIMLSLDGLAGGAATAGCCAQMIGFAVLSFRENGVGGLLAQGLGTSMLQMGNIVKNPKVWLPPTLASMVTGPIATMVFHLENIPAGAGMGTCAFIKTNVQNALKQHGIQAIVDVEVAANINSTTINRCDAIFTSKNIAEGKLKKIVEENKVPVIALLNIMSKLEYSEKIEKELLPLFKDA